MLLGQIERLDFVDFFYGEFGGNSLYQVQKGFQIILFYYIILKMRMRRFLDFIWQKLFGRGYQVVK